MIIYKYGTVSCYIDTALPQHVQEELRFVAAALGYLLNDDGRRYQWFSWPEFATIIAADVAPSPRRDATIELLQSL